MVVSPLQSVAGRLAGAGARKAARQQTHAGANPGAIASTHRGARNRTHRGAHDGAFHAAVNSDLIGCRAASLAVSELPAIGVIGAELIEALARARQRHDARSGRHCRAGAHRQEREQRTVS